jgi:hypothetical protein
MKSRSRNAREVGSGVVTRVDGHTRPSGRVSKRMSEEVLLHSKMLAAALAGGCAITACGSDDAVQPNAAPETAAARIGGSTDHLRVRRVGHPIWRPVDIHLFTAPIGSFETGFAEFGAVISGLMPPPEHIEVLPFFGVGPGAAHAPPYGHELAEGMAANDLTDRHVFPVSAFSARSGNGVYLVFMLVPRPGTRGRSPDFEVGPIIPNAVHPITISGVAIRDGESFDPFLAPESEIPRLNRRVAPQFAGMQGYSHLPFFTATNQLLGPPGTPAEGRYRYEMRMRDKEGNGWNLIARFQVRKNR